MCQKLVVMAVATDCEECNKKALVCLSETSATNGPQGTASQKTQVSVSLLKKGMDRLYMNVIDVDPEFADDILLVTLLKTQVENLHAVSHFKHETFTVLQYAQDFGTIMKESIKRTSRWTAKYYTHDRSYYSVPQSAVPLSAVATMAPLPSEGITPSMENRTDERMVKELQYTNGRLGVRQQKIKLGPCRLLSTLFNPPPTSLKRDFDSLRKSNQIIRSNSVPHPVVSIQFVDDGDVSEMFEDYREVQIDEYETDSDDENRK